MSIVFFIVGLTTKWSEGPLLSCRTNTAPISTHAASRSRSSINASANGPASALLQPSISIFVDPELEQQQSSSSSSLCSSTISQDNAVLSNRHGLFYYIKTH